MSIYFIVVGAGKIGKNLIELALKKKCNVTLVEKDPAKCEEITKSYDVIAIQGDATQEKVLEEANAGEADALVTTLHEDAANLLIVSLAKNLGIKKIASVISQFESKPMFIEKGVKPIEDPIMLAAKLLYDAICRPSIKESMPLGETAEIFRIEIDGKSKLVGRKLKDLTMLQKKALVVAVERNEKLLIPSGNSEIHEGDSLTLIAVKGQVDKLISLLSI
jgi:trk system potassium uptake protein TrkA